MPSLRNALFGFISNACDDKFTLTVLQMKELFKLGLQAIRQTKRIASSPQPAHTTIWEPSSWDALSARLGASERFKSSPTLRRMCRQMAQTSQATTPSTKPQSSRKDDMTAAAAKRKAEVVSGDEEEVATSKKITRKKIKQNKI